ncbi:hypothetical protein AcW1_006811 [Taiwanofungus camphoratus]|nr:hypothetical protein AcW1_006811 [Antrodia cinnamomea]
MGGLRSSPVGLTAPATQGQGLDGNVRAWVSAGSTRVECLRGALNALEGSREVTAAKAGDVTGADVDA